MAQTLAEPGGELGRSVAARPRVYALLALGVVCLAFSAMFVRWSAVPGTVSAGYRLAIAVVALAPIFARRLARGQVPRAPRLWLLAGVAGIFFALDLAFWNTSLFLTSAATSTFLVYDAPIVVGLGTLLIFHERPGGAFWRGLALALVGMGVMAGREMLAGGTASAAAGVGDVLALAGGACYGGYLLMTGRLRARMDAVATLWISGLAGAVLLLAVNLVERQALWGFSSRTVLALLGLGLVTQVGGWLAINDALGHLPASIVSVTLLGQPVLTAVLAEPLLGQPLEAQQVLGGALVLGGIYLVNRGFAQRQNAPPPGPP
ncbi:MAG TPA: DMT family transporter [Ktedonobacterales bacterium]|nr:DMT family transporter [Ktedonobacterales bacterium]